MRGAKRKTSRKIDPIMNDVPYDIIYDDKGKVIAEVFTLPREYLNCGRVKGKRKETR